MGIDRDPPVWPSIQDDGGYQSASSLWIVELECCPQVVLWSHREVWEYVCISTALHWPPRLLNLVVSLRFALQVSLSVLQYILCILHVLGIQSRDRVLHPLHIVAASASS